MDLFFTLYVAYNLSFWEYKVPPPHAIELKVLRPWKGQKHHKNTTDVV